MKKLLLVDDHQIVLDGLNGIFDNELEIEVVAVVRSGKEAIALIEKTQVDIVCTDIEMPGMDGIELAKTIKENHPGIKVLVLSMYSRPELVKQLAAIGVDGFLRKDAGKMELLLAIDHLAKGDSYYSQHFTQSLIVSQKKQTPAIQLTSRELEVLNLLANGDSTAEIAEKLFISFHTVQSHRKSLLVKFDVHNTTSLLKKASQHHLISS
ncbi:response regulator transcription factor [Imperialibacter roseus]|uniref:Response regulator transcription factor n=1 Tax=Imperialibacter roseus TaxID=1324217 RepID=A0ABZ0IVY4_9BACT|nr:response regulator transcription factor [Imperialibacter roseus]WOK09212.1 response regulator transcription factor [Imperialibacter roseus]